MFGEERKGKKERKRKKMKERKKREKEKVIFPGFLGLAYGKRAKEGKRSEKLYLLSKIYGDRVFESHRAKS